MKKKRQNKKQKDKERSITEEKVRVLNFDL